MIIGSGKPTTGRPKRGNYREGRDKKICIRVSEEDIFMLNRICDSFGMTKGDFIISSIRDAFYRVGEMKRGDT